MIDADNPEDDPRLRVVTIEGPCHCVAREKEPRPDWDKHHPAACGTDAYAGHCADEPVTAWADNPLYEGQHEQKTVPAP